MDLYNLFESIDIIVASKIQQLNLDRTVLCTVISTKDKENGKYSVKYDDSIFVANCSHLVLEEKDLVYVGIPANDYNNAYIISKKITETVVRQQTNPYKNFINMMSYESFLNDLSTNNFVSWNKNNETVLFIEDLEKYTHMGIDATFSANVTNEEIKNYGIKLYITTEEDDGQTSLHESILDSTEFLISNPLDFHGQFNVKKVFDIQSIGRILQIRALFYTDNGTIENATIQLNSFNVDFGYYIENINKESAYIYSPIGTMNYDANTNSGKELYLKWIYKDNNEYKVLTYKNFEKMPDNAIIKWEQKNGDVWEEIKIVSEENNLFKIHLDDLDLFKETETFRCQIEYSVFENDTPINYISNSITFTNIEDTSYRDVISNLQLITKQTNYNDIYGSDGKIIDYGITAIPEKIVATAKIDFDKIQKLLETKDMSFKIIWNFPKTQSSMLANKTILTDQKEGWSANSNMFTMISNLVEENRKNNYYSIKDGTLQSVIEYTIDDFYLPTKTNNTIVCEIQLLRGTEILQSDIKTISFDFKKTGMFATDGLLLINLYNETGSQKINAIKPIENGIAKIHAQAQLFGPDGKEIEMVFDDDTDIEKQRISWSFSSRGKDDNDLLSIVENNADLSSCIINAKSLSDFTNDKDLWYVLTCTYNVYDNTHEKIVKTFRADVPIAIDLSNGKIIGVTIPTLVTYNSAGGDPIYYQTSFKAYERNEFNNIQLIQDLEWKEKVYEVENSLKSLYPHIVEENNQYSLSVKNTYIKGATDGYTIRAYYQDRLIWIQPIVIKQINSFSSYVNDWDGSFQLDEEGNQLMSARLGAGKKNEDDSFSGVLLGDCSNSEDGSAKITGVYGFDHNEQSYALKEDGTAFFGKSGAGRINFNGNSGLIYSSNFDGNFYNAQSQVIIDNMNSDDYKIEIKPSVLQNNQDQNIFNAEIPDTNNPFRIRGTTVTDYQATNFSAIISGDGENYPIVNGNNNNKKYIPFTNCPYLTLNNININEDTTGLIIRYSITIDSLSYQYSQLDYLYRNKTINPVFYINKDQFVADQNELQFCTINETIVNGAICYNRIGNTVLLDDIQEYTTRLYSNSKIDLELLIDLTNQTLQEDNTITVMLAPFYYEYEIDNVNSSDPTFARDINYSFEDFAIISLSNNTASLSIQEIEKNKNGSVVLKDNGNFGSFINLKDGQFVTNGGVFRGNLEVESMKLLNEIVIGDPANAKGEPWLRITPEGGLETSGGLGIQYDASTEDVSERAGYFNQLLALGQGVIYTELPKNTESGGSASYLIIKQQDYDNNFKPALYYTQMNKIQIN